MGTWRRSAKDWTAGWSPSSDLVNGSPAGLLRADNVQLDDLGVLSLRRGSAQTLPGYTTALPGGELLVDSLYNAVLNSSPTTLSVSRVVAATRNVAPNATQASVYINGARRDSGLRGTGDVVIHHGFGNVFWCRGARTAGGRINYRKNDGSESGGDDGRGTRNWGIGAPAGAPSFEASDPDGTTFSSCDDSEVPSWEAFEGDLSSVDGNDGTPGGAIELSPDATTGRATATRSLGGDTDFTAYDGGDTGIEEDPVELYVKVGVPENLFSLTLMFDCGSDSDRPFQEDYYSFEMQPEVLIAAKPENLFGIEDFNALTIEDRRQAKFNTDGNAPDSMFDRQTSGSTSEAPTSQIRKDADWTRISVPRKSFQRTGGTPDRGWNTITGIRVVATSTFTDDTKTFGTVAVDNITISGGANHPFTGTYVARYRWVKDFGTYVALSPPSPVSDSILTKANGLSVRIPAASLAAADAQVDECWVYLAGGALNGFYRFATADMDPNQGALVVDVNKREAQAAIDNITLDLNDAIPPDDIVSIAGPYFGRFAVLTPTGVHLSRYNNPDTFSLNEVIKIGDGGEVPYWIVDADGRLLVGTSGAIRQISGSLAALPDGTIDARVDDLNVAAPNDRCVAVDGPVVAYLAADGPRILGGNTSKLIVGNLDLLLRGETRYGVPAMDLGLAPGRSRMAIWNRFVYLVAPEGAYQDGSPICYRYDMAVDRWWRFEFPFTIRSIYRDPANLLECGTNDGQVFLLETGTTDDGAAISYRVQTVSDGLETPLQKKDFHDLIVNCQTGSAASTFAWYADQATAATLTSTVAGTEAAPIHQQEATALSGAKRVGLLITGSSTTGWKLYDYALNFRERPMPRVRWDTGYTPLASQVGRELVWFRQMNLTANSPVDLKVSIYFSGTLYGVFQVPVLPNVTDVYWIPVDRGCKGRQPLIVVTPWTAGEEETAFECYKLGFKLRNTGSASEWKYAEWAPEL